MKKVMILVGDYWHFKKSIEPLMKLLFDSEDEYVLTEKPEDFFNDEYSVLVSFKDPVENDQVPTPVWCDDKWTDLLLERIENGMGFIAVHAAVTDLPEDHRIVTELYQSMFITHPEQCELTFVPAKKHLIFEGVSEFTFPQKDEHYQMNMLPSSKSYILAYTTSAKGKQPALWVHKYGKGKVCMLTPGHDTTNLTCPQYVRLMRNMIEWCK